MNKIKKQLWRDELSHQYMSRKTKYSTLQKLLIHSAMIIYHVILGQVSILLHCTLVVGRWPLYRWMKDQK